MPELPIHPERRDAPGSRLERRLDGLHEASPDAYAAAIDRLRRDCARETLLLSGKSEDADDGELLAAQLEALELIAKASSDADTPTLALIQRIHRLANRDSDGSLRRTDVKPQFKNARSSPPQFVEAKVANLLEWLSSGTGRAMFPAERMALWFGRFLEIAPFEHGNFRTAHLLLSYFAAAARFPPVSLMFSEAADIRTEVERAVVFDTAPLVTRLSEALSRSVAVCEAAVEREP